MAPRCALQGYLQSQNCSGSDWKGLSAPAELPCAVVWSDHPIKPAVQKIDQAPLDIVVALNEAMYERNAGRKGDDKAVAGRQIGGLDNAYCNPLGSVADRCQGYHGQDTKRRILSLPSDLNL